MEFRFLAPLSRIMIAISAIIYFAFVSSNANAQSIIRDSEVESVLRSYSDPIFSAAGLNPKDVKIYIVNDKSLNAFVTDGQKMFLHTGIILEAKNANQLKGVIAHETGHIAGGHLARSIAGERAARVPAFISIALGVAAMAAGAPDAGIALLASSQQFALLNFFTYTRVQEASADQAAFQYLEATKQSSEGLVSFFEKFRYNEVMAEARREPYFRSHPLSSERISALQNKIAKSEFANIPEAKIDSENLALIQAKLYGFTATSAQTFSKYNYKDNSSPSLYARAIAFYKVPDLPMATSLMKKLIEREPNNPYYNELMGQILYENGKINEALPFYEKSIAIVPNDSLILVGLGRVYIAQNSKIGFENANKVLRAALRQEPDNAFAWNQLAIVADRQGKAGLARLATAEEAYSLGDFVRANRFSQVALKNLERKTPEWQRASDIKAITTPIAIKAQKNIDN
jgi:predicted Zn-dependent protease